PLHTPPPTPLHSPPRLPLHSCPPGSGLLACAIPADAERMRADDPELAVAWRRAVRTAVSGAMDDGYRITGFTRSGYYLLEPAPPPLPRDGGQATVHQEAGP
ncbi:MAG: hypothetical protein ACRDNZ_20645, partial [Streptosporangiaceae bacterium]